MIKKIAVFGAISLVCTLVAAREPVIEAINAHQYVGKSVMACGTLAEINHLPNRHYMNLDSRYPNQSITVLIWNKDYRWFENRFGKIDNYIGKRFCVMGNVTPTRNYLQIPVTNPRYVKLMTQ